jgi:hypothetical protein
MRRCHAAIMLALAAAVIPTGAAQALEPHVRDGWILGLSYGGATGDITFANDVQAEVEDGVSPQIRFGRMISRHFALGLSYNGWMYETGVVPTKFRFSMQNVLATATWYPGRPETALGGLHLRLGAGYAWSAIAEVELVPGEEQGHGDRRVDTGLGVEFNIGYEFRVFRSTAVGLGFGVVAQNLDGELYRDTVYTPVTLNLGWYWD